jgi:hypothetical protein
LYWVRLDAFWNASPTIQAGVLEINMWSLMYDMRRYGGGGNSAASGGMGSFDDDVQHFFKPHDFSWCSLL